MAGRLLLALMLSVTACTPPPKTAAAEPPPTREAPPPVTFLGKASWYGAFHHGRRTASGEIFDMRALTAAHRTLPLGTRLRVTNLTNGKSVDVRVNDRGPVIRSRIIDVSHGVAVALDAVAAGVFPVQLDMLTSGGPRNGLPYPAGVRSGPAPPCRSASSDSSFIPARC